MIVVKFKLNNIGFLVLYWFNICLESGVKMVLIVVFGSMISLVINVFFLRMIWIKFGKIKEIFNNKNW